MVRTALGVALLLAGGLPFAAPHAFAQGHVLDNQRVYLDLGDPAYGPATNTNRFDVVSWTKSDGSSTGNLTATGGTPVCGDVYETFGEARGEDSAEEPRFIVAGTRASWTTRTADLSGATKTSPHACKGVILAGTVKSTYTLFTAAAQINLLRVTRVFTFNGSGSGTGNNLRPFMPRLPDATYDTVLVPDASGTIQTFSASACGNECTPSSWNGQWLADDDGNGNGVMVIRSPASASAAQVDIDTDGASDSNSTAIGLIPPAGGWMGMVSETEYLCFYDLTSWPTASRNAGQLPSGCRVKGV